MNRLSLTPPFSYGVIPSGVAQIFNLLYRRLAVGRVSGPDGACASYKPNDKPAIRQIENLRGACALSNHSTRSKVHAPRLVSFLALGLALLGAGCHKEAGSARLAEPRPAAQVQVAKVAEKSYAVTEDVMGTVRSKMRATIEAKVSGRIKEVRVAVGQVVKPGDLLVQLDAHEIQARLDQAKAVLEQARQDLKRFEALLQQKAVTQQEFDAVQARSRVAEAAASEAETMLGYTTITAPFAGVVTQKLADRGDLAAPGRPLLEVEDPVSLRLESDFPEALITRVRPGDKLSVRIAAQTSAVDGLVSEISPAADPNSRTFRVKIDLPTTTATRLGQFGRAAVPLGEVASVRIPAGALVVRGQMEMVFTVAGGRAQMRLVKTGKRFDRELEILSGLQAGDSVVIEAAATLTDGQPVEVK